MVEGRNFTSVRFKHQTACPGLYFWGDQSRKVNCWVVERGLTLASGFRSDSASLSACDPIPQAGTLFEADFSLLDGVKPNIIIFKQQYVTAPLVMLKLEPDGRLLPMVIQV